MSTAVMIAVVLLLLGSGIFFTLRKGKRPAAAESSPAEPVTLGLPPEIPAGAASPVALLAEAKHHYHCTAFSVAALTDTIPAAHQVIVGEVRQALAGIANSERLLPRRPMLLPQLLRALNDTESTRSELASVILQDPVLAADVLKFANSSYYRIASEPVDSLDRAIVLLGTDGLKSVVAASIMQPVFRTPKGQFDAFAPALWELAMRTATAADIYASRTRIADRSTAQLLGLLSALGPLAVFRATSEAYARHPQLTPRAEVYIQLIDSEADLTSSTIAANWQLPETFVLAMYESRGAGHFDQFSPLGRALEAGRCCALLSLAPATPLRSILANKAAMAMGLETTAFDAVWSALNQAVFQRQRST